MKDTIIAAIKNRRLISFRYHDHPRLVEPHLIGINKAGHLALSAYQVGGSSDSRKAPFWRVFLLSDIRQLSTTSDSFVCARPGYNPNDTTMRTILEQI